MSLRELPDGTDDVENLPDISFLGIDSPGLNVLEKGEEKALDDDEDECKGDDIVPIQNLLTGSHDRHMRYEKKEKKHYLYYIIQ